jgi:hypothetical protein
MSDKARAVELKEEGNQQFAAGDYLKALQTYSQVLSFIKSYFFFVYSYF